MCERGRLRSKKIIDDLQMQAIKEQFIVFLKILLYFHV